MGICDLILYCLWLLYARPQERSVDYENKLFSMRMSGLHMFYWKLLSNSKKVAWNLSEVTENQNIQMIHSFVEKKSQSAFSVTFDLHPEVEEDFVGPLSTMLWCAFFFGFTICRFG